MGTLAWHARRQLAAEAKPDLARTTFALGPGAQFYAVRIGEHQVGIASISVDTAPDGLRIVDRTDLFLPVGGRGRRVLQVGEARLSRDLRLREFHVTVSGDHPSVATRGWIEATGQVALARDGAADTVRLDAVAPLVPSALPFRVVFGGRLALREMIDLVVIDPDPLGRRRVRALVSDTSTIIVPDSAAIHPTTGRWVAARLDTVPVWRIDFMSGDAPFHAWVDNQGFIVRAWGGAGYSYERGAFELIESEWRDAVRRGELPPLALPAGGADRAPPMLARLAVALDTTGWEENDVIGSGITRGRQRLVSPRGAARGETGDSVVVERETPAPAAWRLPDGPPGELRAMLAPDPLVPASAPRVVELARRVAGAERDPRVVAERLAGWVSREIAAAPSDGASDGAPDALAALELRRGDADERALLFVALARAAGVPARLASGVVATPQGWRYHTWAEVFLDDWISADPSFGRLPASAANLRLRLGALGRPVDLAALAARLGPVPPLQPLPHTTASTNPSTSTSTR